MKTPLQNFRQQRGPRREQDVSHGRGRKSRRTRRRNPLHKRFKRQLVHEAGKYAGILALLTITVAVTSGALATIASIQSIVAGIDAQNALEDARFETTDAISKKALNAAEKKGHATIYKNFSRDVDAVANGGDATVRLYHDRTQVDTPSYFAGKAPEADNEIALDDTFCTHRGLSVGDTITLDGKTFTICGIMVLSDYTTQMRSNNDVLMDVTNFSVALVSKRGFARFADSPTSYTYSVVFDDDSLTTAQRSDREQDIAQALENHGAELSALLDRDQNQGISYLGTDMKGDGAMYAGFLYVLIGVMAFIFVVLTNATVEQESSVIGTLRASGWRKGEILRHYLFLPAFVGFVAVVVGNILGYTVFSNAMQGLYYGSYSLPPFHASFDAQIFAMTSVVPYALLVGITLIGLGRKLNAEPLAFLRHEVSRGTRRRNLHLSDKLGYVTRFRLRVLARNAPTFATLFVGVFAGSLLVMFSLTVLPMFSSYADRVANSMPTEHIYTLKAPYELQITNHQQEVRDQLKRLLGLDSGADALNGTGSKLREGTTSLGSGMAQLKKSYSSLSNGVGDYTSAVDTLMGAASKMGLGDMAKDLIADVHPVAKDGTFTQEEIGQAEKLCVSLFQVARKMNGGMEDVTVYGIQKNSRYWTDIDVSDGRVVVGRGLLEKCGLEVGGNVVLYDKYTDKSYAFVIDDATGDSADMNLYLSRSAFNEAFGHAEDWFDAYASNDELDISSDYLASTLTPHDMKELSDQMIGMFSNVVQYLVYAAALVFFVVMYLLTKTVLDHSARSISYMKVFGYRDREIRRLYLRPITIAVAVSLIVGLPLTMAAVNALFGAIMLSYPGNYEVVYTPAMIAEELVIGFGTYVVVALLHMRHIKKVPLQLALKSQE